MRDRRLYIRITDVEYEQIHNAALDLKISVSDYVRRCACKRRIASSVDRRAVQDLLKVNADLAREGNLMKFAITEFAEADNEQVDGLIEAAHENVNKLLEMKPLLLQKIQHLRP